MDIIKTLTKKVDILYKKYCCIYDTTSQFNSLSAYADDAAAGVGGKITGEFYQTSGAGAAPLNVAGIVMVKQ